MTSETLCRRRVRVVGRVTGWIIAFLGLGAITQVGAVFLLLAIPVWRGAERVLRPPATVARVALRGAVFLALYTVGTVFVVPPIAAMTGRTPLPCGLMERPVLGPSTLWTCILNRHYVAVDVDTSLRRIAASLSRQFQGARVGYLDAGFPFLDGFPMIPHLSHRDGRAVDLSFFYRDATTGAVLPAPSPLGYWRYVQPRPGDPQPCSEEESWLRWDMNWLQPLLVGGTFDEAATRAMVEGLAMSPYVTRMFLEPHLTFRLGLRHSKVRFQGCKAARHDDHLHVQFAGTGG